jgi:hypothetical protein
MSMMCRWWDVRRPDARCRRLYRALVNEAGVTRAPCCWYWGKENVRVNGKVASEVMMDSRSFPGGVTSDSGLKLGTRRLRHAPEIDRTIASKPAVGPPSSPERRRCLAYRIRISTQIRRDLLRPDAEYADNLARRALR